MSAPTAAARGGAARVLAQAKVNLALRILAREATGYHQLETVFQRLELGDDVTVRVAAGRSIDCRGADVGPAERNLAWRAAVAYAALAGWPAGFAIEIDKRIPVGGGLGGGSADAGATLRALDALAPQPLGPARLLSVAAALGADVPFLTSDAVLALAWGRGERLLALPPLPARDVLLWPGSEGVATADAYRWLADARAASGVAASTARLRAPDAFASWDRIARDAQNDFEDVVPGRAPAIGAALDALRDASRDASRDDGASAFALLAGSGATVFAVSAAPLALSPHAAARTVATRTAARVAAVEVLD